MSLKHVETYLRVAVGGIKNECVDGMRLQDRQACHCLTKAKISGVKNSLDSNNPGFKPMKRKTPRMQYLKEFIGTTPYHWVAQRE